MSALFAWPERISRPSPTVGDRRSVSRFLLLPKKLEAEWRWLGFEVIAQKFQRYRVCPPEMKAMDVVGWRDTAWAVHPQQFLEEAQRANVKQPGRNGSPSCPKPPPPRNPPAEEPVMSTTRIRMEVCPQEERYDESLPWKVTIDGNTVSEHYFQFMALRKAVKIARRMGNTGQLVTLKIKRRDGTIRDERSYPRSSDPKRSKG